MCYGCSLELNNSSNSCEAYLDVREEYLSIVGAFKSLEQKMLVLEQQIIDRDKRKHWHSIRANVIRSKKMLNTAFNDRIGEAK